MTEAASVLLAVWFLVNRVIRYFSVLLSRVYLRQCVFVVAAELNPEGANAMDATCVFFVFVAIPLSLQ